MPVSPKAVAIDSRLPGDPMLAERSYRSYLILLIAASCLIKLVLAHAQFTPLTMADGYDYLMKSTYYVHGDFAMKSYIFDNIWAGITYPLLLSPWMLFESPHSRIFAAFVMNILVSCITLYFSAGIAKRLSGRRSYWMALAIASFSTLFIYSFDIMTENLLLAALAVVGWFVVDIERTFRSNKRAVVLGLVLILAVLTRIPGFVAVAGVAIVAFRRRGGIGPRRAAFVSLAYLVSCVAAYVFFAAQAAPLYGGEAREWAYLSDFARFVTTAEHFVVTLRSYFEQLNYLATDGVCWILPTLAVLLLQMRRLGGPENRGAWIDWLLFTALCSVMFIGLGVLELTRAADPIRPAGRYNDPAIYLLGLAGIAAVWVIQRPTTLERIIFIAGSASPLGAKFSGLFAGFHFGTLAALAAGIAVAAGFALIFGFVRFRTVWGPRALLILFVLFNLYRLQVWHTRIQAESANRTLFLPAAMYLQENTPADAVIAFDALRQYENVAGYEAFDYINPRKLLYRGIAFSNWPRKAVWLLPETGLQNADYFITAPGSPPVAGTRLLWRDNTFAIYEISTSEAR